jgi:hypothetical protein
LTPSREGVGKRDEVAGLTRDLLSMSLFTVHCRPMCVALSLEGPAAIADAAKRTLAQCADNIPESAQP